MGALRLRRLLPALALVGLTGWIAPAAAQGVATPSPIVVVDQERLFAESAFGRRWQREIETRSQALVTENRRIEAELVAEERRLTRERDGMDAAAFRKLAAEFDRKVQRLREEQDAKALAVSRLQDQARQAFFASITGILTRMLAERDAVALLDQRAILLSLGSIDITDEAIGRVDAEIGEGSGSDAPPDATPPATGALPETPETSLSTPGPGPDADGAGTGADVPSDAQPDAELAPPE